MKKSIGKRETGFIFLAVVALCGIAAGAVWTAKGNSIDSPWLHQYFLLSGNSSTLSWLFVHNVMSAILFLLAVFAVGTSAVGQPLALGLLFYRGFGTGIAAASLYGTFGMKAVPMVALLIVPKSAGMLVTAVLSVREAIRSSCGLAYYLSTGDSDENRTGGLRLYLISFIVLTVISMSVSAVDMVFYHFSGDFLRM